MIFVLHRMIECLGEDVLITMDINALQALIVHADLLGIIDIIGLLNQFAAKIKVYYCSRLFGGGGLLTTDEELFIINILDA